MAAYGEIPMAAVIFLREELLVQLRDVAQPNLDAYRRRSLRHGASAPVRTLPRAP